ncbi:MAG: hypothetical protein D3906_09610 [Candidatus Electrothrix sp. AUS1_2]|nr:hypothetical protein [Candidatus Electrothrix sp. AUS1_2]
MDDKYGLLVMALFAVAVLAVISFLKPKPQRNPFLVEIEEWLKTRNKDFQSYFQIDFAKKYPEFQCWKENNEKKK